MKPFYDDDKFLGSCPTPGVRMGCIPNTNYHHDTDAHNLRIIQSDPQLQRILRAYSRPDEAGRAALAQFAAQLPIPPVQVPE